MIRGRYLARQRDQTAKHPISYRCTTFATQYYSDESFMVGLSCVFRRAEGNAPWCGDNSENRRRFCFYQGGVHSNVYAVDGYRWESYHVTDVRYDSVSGSRAAARHPETGYEERFYCFLLFYYTIGCARVSTRLRYPTGSLHGQNTIAQ